MVPKITTGDDSERADCGKRPRFGTAQRVFAITIANDFPFTTARQIEASRKDIAVVAVTRIAIAVGPAFVITISAMRF